MLKWLNIFFKFKNNKKELSKSKKFEIEKFKQEILKRKNLNTHNSRVISGHTKNKNDSESNYKTKTIKNSIFSENLNFQDLKITVELADFLSELKFKHPSEIQKLSIIHTLNGKNLVCSSPTGSGKTLAFVIPTVEKLINKKIDQILVLSPTREIAIQTEKNFKLFSKRFSFTTGLIIGGTDMMVQKKVLREYPNILIATPGRLVDVFLKGLVWLKYTSIVILDEVDLMLDMGFEKELVLIFKEFKLDIQTLAYTATLPTEIKELLSKYISKYETVIVGERMGTKKSVEHKFIKVALPNKINTLIQLLRMKRNKKIIVFFNRIDETIKNFNLLRKNNFKNLNCIHSRKSQEQRNQAMHAFTNKSNFILLATDIASRGIDVPQIDYVVNYSLPMDPEDYIHRIGRTGRADLTGKAITFFNPKNNKENVKLKLIKKLVKSSDGIKFIEHINEI